MIDWSLLNDLLEDLNPAEIASHIEDNTLDNFLRSWKAEFKRRLDKQEDELIDHYTCIMAKYFDPPCSYEYGDIDAYDLINTVDAQEGISWCEANCDSESYKGGAICWKRFFELMEKGEKEQIAYGGEHIED